MTIRSRSTRCASFRNNKYVSIAINADVKSKGFNELKLFELSKMFKPMKEWTVETHLELCWAP